MPRGNIFSKALARINTKTSVTPVFQPPFNERPSLPIIRITSSSSSTSPASPIIHNSPFQSDSPTLTHPTTIITPSPSPPAPPPTTSRSLRHPDYHLHNRYLRTLVLLLTPPLIHAAHIFLADHGYGTGAPHHTVTEADELDFFHTLDAFLCLLDPNSPTNTTTTNNWSVGAITPPAEGSGRRCWPEGLHSVGSRYLGKLMRGLEAEREFVVEKWVEVEIKGRGFGEYVAVVDGFLGVLEGREWEGMVEERAMMRGALMGSADEGVEGRLKELEDELMTVIEGFELGVR